ncbi:unnamed protein product [Notodromas monacha]|uniref:Huntingtin n=1 Tax=Notodromas monacha TaxID=399045 RepID=A0A7R9GFI1_9CRUS|nr:unnamed protein product [Notodromas monacha]CAG0920728.1 unnamed protein product [Notodromas monacha]
MAVSLDRFLKTVEGIRQTLKVKDAPGNTTEKSGAQADTELVKREKIGQINQVVDGLTSSCKSPGVLTNAGFVSRALSPCLELLLLFCDDEDADVRLHANDGLTKCVRLLSLTHSGRLESELYKEIKKNGNQRSLRAALCRFGIVAPLIRLSKRRAYAGNLSSVVMRVCSVRNEESLWESLTGFFQSVWPSLGPYFMDSENKKLLRVLFARLEDESTAMPVRRNAGQCIAAMAKYSRNPEQTIGFLLDIIADEGVKLLGKERSVYLHSCLMLMRNLVPLLRELPVDEITKRLGCSLKSVSGSDSSASLATSSSDFVPSRESVRLNQYLFIYEVGMRSTQSRNTSVCTAALELLQVLLLDPPLFFISAMRDTGGLGATSRIRDDHEGAWENLSAATSILSIGKRSSVCEDVSVSLAFDDGESLNSFKITTSCQRVGQGSENQFQGSSATDPEWDPDCNTNSGDYCGIKMGVIETDDADASFNPALMSASHQHEESDDDDDDIVKEGSEIYEEEFPNICHGEEEHQEALLPDTANRTFGDIGSFHFPEPQVHFCARVVANTFLLRSNNETCLIPESLIRVSLQALAVSVLGNLAAMEPKLLQIPINVTQNSATFVELLKLASHRDPIIRANVASLCGAVLKSALLFGLGQPAGFASVGFQTLWDPIAEAVFDSAPLVGRAGLKAVAQLAGLLLRSEKAHVLLRLARQWSILAKTSSYWLVKVELLSLLAEIPVAEMEFLMRVGNVGMSESYLKKSWTTVICPLLGDENPKVRTAAAEALVQLCCKSFHLIDTWDGSAVSAVAANLTLSHSNAFGQKSLSRIVAKSFNDLHEATSSEMVVGNLEALACLVAAFPPKEFREAWFCTRVKPAGANCQALGNLGLLINLTMARAVCSDLRAVTDLVIVATSIFEGLALEHLKPLEKETLRDDGPNRKWEALDHPQLDVIAQLLMTYLIRMICMTTSCLCDIPPSKAAFQAAKEPSTLSPTLLKTPEVKTVGSTIASPMKRMMRAVSKQTESLPTTVSESEEPIGGSSGKKKAPGSVGSFAGCPDLLRVHEMLRAVYENYKFSASNEQKAEKKLMTFIVGTLEGLGRMLEFASSSELCLHAEEILHYLQIIMPLCPAAALKSVSKLLHCLFASNAAALGEKDSAIRDGFLTSYEAKQWGKICEGRKDPSSFYQVIFGGPYRKFSTFVKTVRANAKPQTGSSRPPLLIKTGPLSNRSHLSNFIRLFEPVVIYSLKVFTSSPEVHVQSAVLSLLVTLIRLRVNYHLLDNEQIFLNYVLRQFDLVEEGLVSGPNSPIQHLLPWLLRFLVLLSHDSIHTKGQSLLPFSKLIQLCDGLMASEFDLETHCLPAMGPLVEDLFLWRSKGKDKVDEIEAQKEVIVTMLMRLLPSIQVIRVLTMIVIANKELGHEESYQSISKQFLNAILPLMAKWEIAIESEEDAEVLVNFFAALSPVSFHHLDSILEVMALYPSPEKVRKAFPRWLAGVVCCLGVAMTHGTEDAILSRLLLSNLLSSVTDESSVSSIASDVGEDGWVDPLGAHGSPKQENYLKERTATSLARFLLDTLTLAAKEIAFRATAGFLLAWKTLGVHLVGLLMHVSHMVQSGEFRRTANCLKNLIVSEESWESDLHENIVKLGFINPLIPLYWMNLLSLLNCGNVNLWSKILKTSKASSKISSNGEASNCSREVIRRGTLIVYCDYIHENLFVSSGGGEELTWLLVNHLKSLVCLNKEPPVADLVAALHRNCASSQLFLHAIRHRLIDEVNEISVCRGVLSCLTECPAEVSFALLELCVYVLMPSKILATSYKGFQLGTSAIDVLVSDEQRHKAQDSTGLVVPNVCSTASDYSEDDEEEEERRMLRVRKPGRILELNDIKPEDIDELITKSEDKAIKSRFPRFVSELRKLRIIAFGSPDSGIELSASAWSKFCLSPKDSNAWSKSDPQSAYRIGVDKIIAESLRHREGVSVQVSAKLINGLNHKEALQRIGDEDFPLHAIPVILKEVSAARVIVQNMASNPFSPVSPRARGGGKLSEEKRATDKSDGEESSFSSTSTGPFGDYDTDLSSPILKSSSGLEEQDRFEESSGVSFQRSAIVSFVIQRMSSFFQQYPKQKEVFMPTSWSGTEAENEYTEAVIKCLGVPCIATNSLKSPTNDKKFSDSLDNRWSSEILPFCECLLGLSSEELPTELAANCALAALEGAKMTSAGEKWLRKVGATFQWTVYDIQMCIRCCAGLLSIREVWLHFASNGNWSVSAIEAIFAVVESHARNAQIPRIETLGREFESVDPSDQSVLSACIKASRLALWVHALLQDCSKLDSFEWSLLPLVAALCRLPAVYGFVRIPSDLLQSLAFQHVTDKSGNTSAQFVWKDR